MATRYLVPGGDGNYNSTSNWSATDGGVSGATFPVAADDIIINANSLDAPITVNVVSACRSFNASNYTGTWTISNNLSVNGTAATGNITLSSGMTITGSASFIKVPTSTTGVITSNGVLFNCNFIFQAAATTTTTITGAMQVDGNVTWSLNSAGSTNTINGSTLSIGGDIIHNSTVAGTSTIEMIGSTTATITQVATRYLSNNLIINKTGILNINNLYWGTASRTLTYTSGIVNHTGTLFATANTTLNTNGMTWNILNPAGTISFTSIFNADTISKTSGSFNFSGTHPFVVNNLSLSSAASIVFTNNLTYTINQSLLAYMTTSGTFRAASSVGCNLDVAPTATVALYRGTFLYINSRIKALRVYKPVSFTNTQNIFSISGNINQYSSTI